MLKKYINYLKDNPERYWFKRKIFGWGWIPATWQGWLVILGFIALIFFNTLRLEAITATDAEMTRQFIPQTVILVLLLLVICWNKGEKPRWQWGLRDAENKKEDERL